MTKSGPPDDRSPFDITADAIVDAELRARVARLPEPDRTAASGALGLGDDHEAHPPRTLRDKLNAERGMARMRHPSLGRPGTPAHLRLVENIEPETDDPGDRPA